jgi:primosomal replication protein N
MTARPNRTVTARIEVCGRLASLPALRVTPAGSAVLSVVIDCGSRVGELLLPVVMTGEAARAIGLQLKQGVEVRAHGSLRSTLSRIRSGPPKPGVLGVEVLADEITLAADRN